MNHKGIKLHTVLGTCLAAALPCLAVASAPSDAAMGQVDAILNFCVKSVPRLDSGARTYRALFTASTVAPTSKAYKEAYEQVSSALAKGNLAHESAACAAGLEVKSRREEHKN